MYKNTWIMVGIFYVLLLPDYCLCENAVLEPAKTLTLEETIKLSRLNNKSIQIQEEGIYYAKAGISDAKSAFLPKLNAGYSYTFNGSILKYPSSLLPSGRKDIGIYTGYKNDNSLKFSVVESVYNGGADIASLAEARLALEVQEETLRATKLEVEFNVKRLFNGLLLAIEMERIAKDQLERARVHYNDVEKMYGQGTASKFDLLQSKVQVSNLIPPFVKAQSEVKLVAAELKREIGLKQDCEIVLNGNLAYGPVDTKEDDYLKEAFKSNPEMVLKLLGIDVSKWQIEYAKSGWRPDISASANYYYRSDNLNNMINSRHDNWDIGVSANILIFDGFSTKAKVDEAKSKYNQAFLQKEDYVDQITIDVKNAYLDLRDAEAVVLSEKDSVVEAKEALRIAVVGYENGVKTNLEVLTSQVSLGQTETNLAQAMYDHMMAIAQLERLTGREYFSGKPSPVRDSST